MRLVSYTRQAGYIIKCDSHSHRIGTFCLTASFPKLSH